MSALLDPKPTSPGDAPRFQRERPANHFKDSRALNISELRTLASRRLPRTIFEFVDRGAEDDIAIAENRQALARLKFKPRILKDVSNRSQTIELFGERQSMPIVIGPTGMAGILWHDGEIALARAARQAGIPFTLSTGSMNSLERVAEAGASLWFQLYMWPDRQMSYELISRVKDAGYRVLIVTVDTPVTPNREFNRRNGLTAPFRMNRHNAVDLMCHPKWLLGVLGRYMATTGMPRFENYPRALQMSLVSKASPPAPHPRNDSLTWSDFQQIRAYWTGPLIVKGILNEEDAELACQNGADGIVVSNHGGRNLDGSIPPIAVLSSIVDRVANRATVMVDSGFLRGGDIVKALALGAAAVLVGRAPLWGVAAAGEAGAARSIAILRDEIDRTMALVGAPNVQALDRGILAMA